ncbi:helix-turn-helix domain-containing protein [Alicyclobacillus vulcanalis]|uniref:helix-turn-helix domain-containing protein n=1 Tax=Alicyclobacillus vulcanalis TaxID=252246 RepID=UPI001F1C34E2|nr:helix-turn-helix transcriptional regulator [Alicyclobacillus vulcanalis]
MSIGETIRTLRTSRGLSQAELAGELISPERLNEIESGRALAPYPLLIQLADRLGASIDSLVGDADPHGLLQAAIHVAQYDIAAGHYSRARHMLTHLPEASFHTRGLAEYRLTLARALRGDGADAEAVQLLLPLAEAAEASGDARVAFYALRELGYAECDRGNVPAAVRLWKDALAHVDAIAASRAIPAAELRALTLQLYLHLDDLDPRDEGFDVPWKRTSLDPQPPLRAEFAPVAAAPEPSAPGSAAPDAAGSGPSSPAPGAAWAPPDRPHLAAALRWADGGSALFAMCEKLANEALCHLATDPSQARALADQATELLYVGRLAEMETALDARLGKAEGFSSRLQRAYLTTAVSPWSELAAFGDEIAERLEASDVERAALWMELARSIERLLPPAADVSAKRARLKLDLLALETAYLQRPQDRAALRQRLLEYEQSFPEWGETAVRMRACRLLVQWLAEARDFEQALRYVQKIDLLGREPRPQVPFVF